eukprot:gnl/MRDRNA2_/MRDRNA2_235333_c0_seq1.p1 gnl/MRDRNA2_/MRDRNA2_235333_c0~~gnl/MRDRNA2_/MRDRNA2_235333_c0_seq1.p1  ORF type:complete len:256 (-),score=50.53 gnl/MRDRNA2_/MRDRNA2_235333_c0_seq1:72-779(-)
MQAFGSRFRKNHTMMTRYSDFALRIGSRVEVIIPAMQNLSYIKHGAWRRVVTQVLGDDVIEKYVSVIVAFPEDHPDFDAWQRNSTPGWFQQHCCLQAYHRDERIPGPNQDEEMFQKFSMQYGIAVIIPLVDVEAANGPTELMLGSHNDSKDDNLNELGVWEQGQSITPSLLKGQTMMYDLRLYHRGLENTSPHPRPLLQINYVRASHAQLLQMDENFGVESVFQEKNRKMKKQEL